MKLICRTRPRLSNTDIQLTDILRTRKHHPGIIRAGIPMPGTMPMPRRVSARLC